MTEDEARAKWCPFQETAENYNVLTKILFQVTPRHGAGVNYITIDGGSPDTPPPRSRCIASECMMWDGFHKKCGLMR